MTSVRVRAIGLVVLVLCTVSGSFSVDLTQTYSEDDLKFWQPRYAATTAQLYRAILGEEIGQPPALTASQRQQLGNVTLRFPLPVEQKGPEARYAGDPLMFYSQLDPAEVTLPVLSLKFFSELCLAYEWLDINGYEMASPTIYMKLLKYNRPTRFPDGRYPPLLRAIGIPDDARRDRNVEQRYFFAFNHLRMFVLLHELGHIYHRHVYSVKERQAQEIEADSFAFEALRRLEAPPVGTALYFTAAANLQLNRSDFKSAASWTNYLQGLSHPASELRLQRASDYIKNNLKEFAGGDDATAESEVEVRQMSDALDKLSKLLGDAQFQMVPPKSRFVDMSPLALRKRKSAK